jgi:hypothetical protein
VKKKRVGVEIDSETVELLRKVASETGLSMNQVAQGIIRWAMTSVEVTGAGRVTCGSRVGHRVSFGWSSRCIVKDVV